jgi:eukaryotic-like serine/threonine-protein kinase
MHDHMIGQTFSHYCILSKLGEGGMGMVYLAEDTRLKRNVALKFLPSHLTQSEEELARFQQEAEAISALNHPYIATIYDIDEAEGQVFLVIEYIPGDTLKARLEAARAEGRLLPIKDVLEYGEQIAEGLAHAHRHHIIHRDIKPDNVMLTEDGMVKITDFGLAKLQGNKPLTKAGSIVGTAAYMSPEQIRGEDIDERSDLFSLGILLYELATSQPPFRGMHEAARIYSTINEDPPPVRSLRTDVPDTFDALIASCLAKDRDKRCANASHIAVTLKRSRQEMSGVVKTVVVKSLVPWKVIVACLIAAIVCIAYFLPRSAPVAENRKTIAVLPLVNLSEDGKDEHISDGISEDILTQLCKVADLKVIARTSVMQYKDTKKTIREIGNELNAGVVLTGSVRLSGNRIRIVSQLVDAASEEYLWAETYDREMKDVFAIQSEIAEKIVVALKAKLSPAERQRIESPGTSNAAVYNLLLQGRYFHARSDSASIAKAVTLYRQALAIDSTDARVWAALATSYSAQAYSGYIGSNQGYANARQAALRALALDNNLAAAHTALGRIKREYDWDWTGAEAEYQKALAVEPGDAATLGSMSALAATLGRIDDAIALDRKAIVLDPVSAALYSNLGWHLMRANKLLDAVSALHKALELNPGHPYTHQTLGLVYLLDGNTEQAIEEMRREPDDKGRMHGLALAYVGAGRSQAADEALRDYINADQDEGAFQIAEIYAYRGDINRAFEWLERAYAQKDAGLADMLHNPFLKKIAKDARFKAFLTKMRLHE